FTPDWVPSDGGTLFTVTAPALAADGSIVLATDDGRLLALSSDLRTKLWGAGLPGDPTTPLLTPDSRVWVGLNGAVGGIIAVKG
ncbi:hypothetical protein N4A85_25145, partial [Escherichia coli]|uniref:hypothetical protein n=1 Tax=Escherichia coli TaxID=562 RepID=UPI0021B60BD1